MYFGPLANSKFFFERKIAEKIEKKTKMGEINCKIRFKSYQILRKLKLSEKIVAGHVMRICTTCT